MDLARPGAIKAHCDPNALATFQEYLNRFASDETRRIGDLRHRYFAILATVVAAHQAALDGVTRQLLERILALCAAVENSRT